MYARTMLERMKSGKRRSAANIRAIKVLVALLAETCGSGAAARERIAEKVADAVREGKEINPDALEKVFRTGDLKKYPVIDAAIATMRHLNAEDNANGEAKADTGPF
jgi:hypothetical protein